MAITYTWQLTALKKKNVGALNNFIAQTYWKKIGTDEYGNTGEFNGATPFTPEADSDPATFVRYEDLTEAQILIWIKAVDVNDYENHVNAQIKKQIDSKFSPETDVASGSFPWNPTA